MLLLMLVITMVMTLVMVTQLLTCLLTNFHFSLSGPYHSSIEASKPEKRKQNSPSHLFVSNDLYIFQTSIHQCDVQI